MPKVDDQWFSENDPHRIGPPVGEIIGGRDIVVGSTYTCPDCGREYDDVEAGEVLKPCQSDDCPQHWEEKGLTHPANIDAKPLPTHHVKVRKAGEKRWRFLAGDKTTTLRIHATEFTETRANEMAHQLPLDNPGYETRVQPIK